MLLSIIVPMYNSRAYLPTLIDSLCRQRERDFEVVFVDDGSTDGSYERLCELLKNSDLCATVHRQENGGVSAARNAGATLAKGDYLSFVDSDDAVSEDYVLTLKTQVQRAAVDVLLFRSVRVGENAMLTPHGDTALVEANKTAVLERFIGNPTALSMCNVFICRERYEANGLSFRVGYKYYEDYELLYRTIATAETLAMTERELYFYIQRGGSAMARFTVDRLSCMTLMDELVPLLQQRVPAFVSLFEKWMTARLSWSVMWQASRAFSLADARRFAKHFKMKQRLSRLYDYPDRKVRLSARLFGVSPAAFILSARLLTRHSHVERAALAPFLEYTL